MHGVVLVVYAVASQHFKRQGMMYMSLDRDSLTCEWFPPTPDHSNTGCFTNAAVSAACAELTRTCPTGSSSDWGSRSSTRSSSTLRVASEYFSPLPVPPPSASKSRSLPFSSACVRWRTEQPRLGVRLSATPAPCSSMKEGMFYTASRLARLLSLSSAVIASPVVSKPRLRQIVGLFSQPRRLIVS